MSYRLMDGLDFLRSLQDSSVDGIFTDPPWGLNVSESSTGHITNLIVGNRNWLELIKPMTDEAARVLKPDGRCLIWLGVRHVGPVCRIVDKLEYRWMVFVRRMPPKYMAGLESFFDAVVYFCHPGAKWPSKLNGRNKPQEYFYASTGKCDTAHPCARPYRNVKEILSHWFAPGEYVVDPFAGSDTMGVACRELNINYDSCEIDPAMYQTGIERNRQIGMFET